MGKTILLLLGVFALVAAGIQLYAYFEQGRDKSLLMKVIIPASVIGVILIFLGLFLV